MTTSRSVIDSHTKNYTSLVDQTIRSRGELVQIFYPLYFTNNVYGDREEEDYGTFETGLIFNWDEYRTKIKFSDVYTESQIPLIATAALEDHIPEGSVVGVELENPNDDANIPPQLEEDHTQAVSRLLIKADSELGNRFIVLDSFDVDMSFTLADEIGGVDTRGIKGNEWSIVLDFKSISQGFHGVLEIELDVRDRKFIFIVNSRRAHDFITEWEDAGYGTAVLNVAFSEHSQTGPTLGGDSREHAIIYPFIGGLGSGLAFPAYRDVNYVNQSTEFIVVKNEIQHEHYAYQRRLTLIPRRSSEERNVETEINL